MGREEANGRGDASLAGRNPRHLQPSVPAWDQAGPPLPWWETVSPSPSPRTASIETVVDVQKPSNSPTGEAGTGERGWSPMKRILIAFATLAALFLVVGAHTQWP